MAANYKKIAADVKKRQSKKKSPANVDNGGRPDNSPKVKPKVIHRAKTPKY